MINSPSSNDIQPTRVVYKQTPIVKTNNSRVSILAFMLGVTVAGVLGASTLAHQYHTQTTHLSHALDRVNYSLNTQQRRETERIQQLESDLQKMRDETRTQMQEMKQQWLLVQDGMNAEMASIRHFLNTLR